MQAFDLALVHVVKDVDPGVFAIDFGQVIESPAVFFFRGVAVHGFHQRDGEFRRVRPVVPGTPGVGFGWSWRDALHPAFEAAIGRIGDFEVAGQVVKNPGDVGGALNVGVSAQGVHAAAGASHIAEHELQDGGACG